MKKALSVLSILMAICLSACSGADTIPENPELSSETVISEVSENSPEQSSKTAVSEGEKIKRTKKGDKSWYGGAFEVQADVTLKKK